MGRIHECKVNQFAKTYHLVFVIMTYIVVFVYFVFVGVVNEGMKRYYVCMELPEDMLRDYL
jgi:hypothetical protein